MTEGFINVEGKEGEEEEEEEEEEVGGGGGGGGEGSRIHRQSRPWPIM